MNFLPSPSVLAGFTAACVLLALTPGPDMTLFLSRTISGGRKLGLAALLGASCGLVVHALLAAFGLSALLAASAPAFTALKLVGGVYLLWLAYQALRHGSALALAKSDGKANYWATFATGVGINLTNPKIVIFFLTFLPQFVEAGDPNASAKFLCLGLYFLVLGTVLNLFVLLVAGRFVAAVKANPKALRGFDFGFAGLMGLFALKLFTAQGR